MRVFLDANVIVYSAVDGRYREACLAILGAVADDRIDGCSSPAVLEEVWHVEHSGRAGQIHGLARHAHTILAPLLPVTDAVFRRALVVRAPRAGTNDRVHLATCLEHGIVDVLSADSDLDTDEPVRRIDPLDSPAVERLWSA